jgi:putative transposase
MDLGHVIALDPTVKQANALARAAGCARFAYNWGLDEWQRQYETGRRPTVGAVKKAFNAIKRPSFPWIYESPKDANQQALNDLGVAFKNFFDSCAGRRKGHKLGHPTYRKRGQDDSFYVSNDKFSVSTTKQVVRLPVIGNIRTHEALRLHGRVLCGRVYRTAGRWYLAVNVECEARVPNVPDRPIIGVDLGVKTAVVPSRGDPIDAPKPLAAALARRRRANRTLHRRKKGSANRRKAALRVARIHQRVACLRKDFLHKVTTRLCRENQAVVIEDLNVAGMTRNRHLARAILDVGLGTFRSFMSYKGPLHGCEVVVASRWFPSSKRCSGCGEVKAELALGQRTFVCERCGLVIDRDLNAAMNLEQYPGLPGNETPTETAPLSVAPRRRARAVAEVGTNPCALARTS